MPDIKDGEIVYIQGSARSPYILRNVWGIYSCTCMSWRNQSKPIERRTCKHLKKYRGEQIEYARVGGLGDVVEPKAKEAKEKKEAAPVLLANTWKNDIDLTNWNISEKLDGVRCYWTGKEFLSRNGNKYYAPPWFLVGLPVNEPLDGELWMARKSFQTTSGIVRRQDGSGDWNKIKYLVFDAPAQKMPFEERMRFLYELSLPKTAEILPQIRCKGLAHLREELARVEAMGGEGLMLREPGSFYEVGRSHTLLKVKNFKDATANIIDFEKGKGRHKGRVGAFVCMSKELNNVVFKVGTGLNDDIRTNPPAVGTSVTFRYQELSDGGVPRFPSFVRVN